MGYAPEWNRQSMAKTGSSKPKQGIVSKPLFHQAEQKGDSSKQNLFTRHYADGGEVYNETDPGLLGGEVKFRTDYSGPEARKYVATPKSPMGGSQPAETRYYSMDDVKNFFTGGEKKEADTVSYAPAPKTSGEAAPSSENEKLKMGIAAPKSEAAKSEAATSSSQGGTFSNWKSDAPKYERVQVDTSTSQETAPRKSKSSSRSAASSSGKASNYKAASGESKSSSKSEAKTSRASAEPASEADIQAAQDAGSRFVSLTNYVKNLPAGTSPQDRAKAGQLMRDAQTDYENKSKKVRKQ